MARDSIFTYIAQINDGRTAAALRNIFLQFVPQNGEQAGAVQTTMNQELVAAYTVNPDTDNGKTFYLNASTEFATTLPAPALGLRLTFIVKTAPSGASYTVVTSGSANIIKGQAYPASGAAGDTGTADDTITFTDGAAVAGDRLDLFCDGTSWFAYGHCAVATGIVFTQAT